MYEGKEYLSVTIVERSGNTLSSHQDDVAIEHVKLMFEADYVTIRGTTIKKAATEVNQYGSVTFYGVKQQRSDEFLNI